MIDNLIKHRKTILLTGPSGTGKTTWAYRTFKNRKIIHVNICEIDESLLSSQLFGHAKGAFTGAISDHKGFVEEASGGVLFLDEIGDIKADIQKKLLMFLDTKEYFSLGCVRKKKFNGQIVLATNKNLKEMVFKKEFREDLYYRIKTFEYKFDPINTKINQKNIIENTLNLIMKKIGEKRFYDDKIIEILSSYSWPGNYRELVSVIEYLILNSTQQIRVKHFPRGFNQKKLNGSELDFSIAKSNFERSFLKTSLMKYNYKINETARQIGISKVTLLKKIKEYRLVENDV